MSETKERNKREKDDEETQTNGTPGGADALRCNHMMAHLMDSLDAGKDIGHYGQLVFAIIGRHFLNEDDLTTLLAKSEGFGEERARSLVHQVNERDYSPPRREKILEYQKEQAFPILPDVDDPDEGNVYRDLTFPDHVYEHISQYHEQKATATE